MAFCGAVLLRVCMPEAEKKRYYHCLLGMKSLLLGARCLSALSELSGAQAAQLLAVP